MNSADIVKAFQDPMSMANPAIAKIVGNVAGLNTTHESTKERAYINRPRSTSNDPTNRGQICYIKLLTSGDQRSQYSSGNSTRTNDFTGKVKQELTDSLKALSSSSETVGYDSFFLTSVDAALEEKLQIVEVFGDNEVAYYFGRAPMIFNMGGTLIDSVDTGWFTQWVTTYGAAMRGTELARNFELLKIVLPNMTVIGSMVNFRWSQTSMSDVAIGFSFQFYVKSIIPTPVTAVNTAITNAAQSINFTSMNGNSFASWKSIIEGKFNSTPGGFLDGLGDTSSSASKYLDELNGGITSSVAGFLKGSDVMGGIFSKITGGLASLRKSLFAPIYGVMNSLTRLVKNVFGSITSVFNALTAPIKNILGDISRIASMATSLINMTVSGLVGFGRGLSTGFGVYQSYLNAVKSIKLASGTIAAAPQNVASGMRQAFNYGFLPTTAAFLKANPKASLSATATLSARPGAKLNNARAALSPQLAILSSTPATTTLGAAL